MLSPQHFLKVFITRTLKLFNRIIGCVFLCQLSSWQLLYYLKHFNGFFHLARKSFYWGACDRRCYFSSEERHVIYDPRVLLGGFQLWWFTDRTESKLYPIYHWTVLRTQATFTLGIRHLDRQMRNKTLTFWKTLFLLVLEVFSGFPLSKSQVWDAGISPVRTHCLSA